VKTLWVFLCWHERENIVPGGHVPPFFTRYFRTGGARPDRTGWNATSGRVLRCQGPYAPQACPEVTLHHFYGCFCSGWNATSGRVLRWSRLHSWSLPSLAPYQPEFRHLLVDLDHIDADDLQGALIFKTSLLALKASHQGLHHELPRLFRLLAEMTRQDSSLGMIRALLRYICIDKNDLPPRRTIRTV